MSIHLNETDSSIRNVFLFVNPVSGGKGAQEFTQSGVEYFRCAIPYTVSVYIYDIRKGESGAKYGFLELRRLTDSLPEKNRELDSSLDDLVLLIVAGGDGTVIWCIQELLATKIDISKVVLGVLPYGTGNDFARVLNWKPLTESLFDNGMHGFKKLLTEWYEAGVVNHDIWKVKVDANEGGSFLKIDSKTRKKKVVTTTPEAAVVKKDSNSKLSAHRNTLARHRPCSQLSFIMSNYFSVGVESRIGLGFDQRRTRSALLNKLRYFMEGIKKTFKKTASIEKIISKCTDMENGQVVFATIPDIHSRFSKNAKDICSTEEVESGTPILLPSASLIFSNIPSFASRIDTWKNSKGNLGLRTENINRNLYENMLTSNQLLGDGILEAVSFQSAAAIGIELAIKGQGRRVYQGYGPLKLNFRPYYVSTKGRRVYFQVDGEFYMALNPKDIELSHFIKIKVLQNCSKQFLSLGQSVEDLCVNL